MGATFMSNAATVVPQGFRENGKGHLVPESMISPVDQMTDNLVKELAARWQAQRDALAELKKAAFGDVHALITIINEQYSVKRGGEKGNVQLFSYDGRFKLLVAVNETIGFGPELQAAQEKIQECLQGWTENARPELAVIVHEAFQTDGQGGIRVGRILQLRRYRIESEDWKLAMQALDEALRVVGSKQYIRLYERDALGAYIPIPLDIAAL